MFERVRINNYFADDGGFEKPGIGCYVSARL